MKQNQGISACELFNSYRYDNDKSQFRDDVRTSRTYFDRLRNVIVKEYEEQGCCELIDLLMQQQGTIIDAVTCAALIDAGYILMGDSPCNIEKERFVPNVNYEIRTLNSRKLAEWEDCIRPADCSYTHATNMKSYLEAIRIAGKASYRVLKQRYGAESTLTSDQKETQLLQDARQRAQEIQEEAQEKAHSILAEAKKIRAEAKEKAGDYLRQARADAETEARAERRDAVQESVREGVLPVQQYFAKDWENIRQDYEKSLSAMREENQKAAADLERKHDQMVDQTNAIQRELAARMTAAVEDISGMKEELYKKLQTWQADLFPQKYIPLAQRYVELYQVINKSIKRLLESEASNQYSKPGGIFHRHAEDPGIDAGASNTVPSTLAELQKLHKNLTTFLQRFENAMGGIGLYVFYPEEGTPFDDVKHMVEDDQVDPEGRTIVGCTVPGIAKKTIDAEEDDVLIRATVTVM